MKKAVIIISVFICITISLVTLQKLFANGGTGILLVHNHNPKKIILVQVTGIAGSPCFVVLPKAKEYTGAKLPTETTLSFDSRDHNNNLIGKVWLFDVSKFDPKYTFGDDPSVAKIRCSQIDPIHEEPFYETEISLTSANPNILIENMEDGTVRMRT